MWFNDNNETYYKTEFLRRNIEKKKKKRIYTDVSILSSKARCFVLFWTKIHLIKLFCKINSYISFFFNYVYILEFNEKQSNFKAEKNILNVHFNMLPSICVHTKCTINLIPWKEHRIQFFMIDFWSKIIWHIFPCTKCLRKNDLYIDTNPVLKITSMNFVQMEGYYKKKLLFFGLFYKHYFIAIIVWGCSEKFPRYSYLTRIKSK